MQKARYLLALSCAFASAACGTEVARAVYSAPGDGGVGGIPEKPPTCLSGKITSRLTSNTIQLAEDVHYKRAGYFFGLPQDDRIAFSPLASNGSLVAWLNNAGTQVHVTSLNPDFKIIGTDAIVDGTDLSGLVALEDGFAVLTRRPDPGELVGDGGTQAQATYLVRVQNGREVFAVPLTGTRSITPDTQENDKRDFPIGLSGRLAFNGAQYGAYFAVRGGQGDKYVGTNSDKLVLVDEFGQFVPGGWRMGCRQNLGGRLVAEMGRFSAFCMSDGNPGAAGVYLVTTPRSTKPLATESSFSGGYAGGNLGSAIKLADGYLVGWASRGVQSTTDPSYAFESHEPAVALLGNDLKLVPPPVWPFLAKGTRPSADAVNVHVAPYGTKVLMVWETIEDPLFRASNGYSTGNYGGTHFRLLDARGNAASDEEVMPDSIAPNGPDDIIQFPNGDLGWALVAEERNFQTLVTQTAVSNVTPLHEIKLVRLSYCTP